jgi:quercetin dioxygenase-like cupin family protein
MIGAMAELQFLKLTDLRPMELVDGVSFQPLFGEGAQVNLVELQPGSVVPAHSHPHEQLGICLRGVQILEIDGQDHHVGPMDAYVIPGGIEHGARCGPEGATVIDVFQPVREDYKERYEA